MQKAKSKSNQNKQNPELRRVI